MLRTYRRYAEELEKVNSYIERQVSELSGISGNINADVSRAVISRSMQIKFQQRVGRIVSRRGFSRLVIDRGGDALKRFTISSLFLEQRVRI